jgi:hypothetical protein
MKIISLIRGVNGQGNAYIAKHFIKYYKVTSATKSNSSGAAICDLLAILTRFPLLSALMPTNGESSDCFWNQNISSRPQSTYFWC